MAGTEVLEGAASAERDEDDQPTEAENMAWIQRFGKDSAGKRGAICEGFDKDWGVPVPQHRQGHHGGKRMCRKRDGWNGAVSRGLRTSLSLL